MLGVLLVVAVRWLRYAMTFDLLCCPRGGKILKETFRLWFPTQFLLLSAPLHVFAAGRGEAGSVKGALLVRVYGAVSEHS